MTDQNTCSGMAALSICEALLLALNDHKILPAHEVIGVLQDAAATHEGAAVLEGDFTIHREVAALINRIIAGGHSLHTPGDPSV
jgi:hypothetical protein